ncbi:hypothetical protein KL905_001414 [Ogataea polymorpha]|nr:uncharacterized protein OGAPODRAFT_15713 [Ogataea polymorpha]KAG7879921.1 hypothetical protein KL937_002805 [Ogataea polymorpha]KAG7893010.1 hypothetical protein KL936_001184 [Ogataea polymorpha]KAG7897007.1 hypothetical protein KL908_000409 [Ogataea polymorpha]KAG7912207.1 hypothetical protein KL906_000411 [Ogataea polymorpha]KAG7923148.1 hypothetical protein KL905_001414 [Ogataea polymorpha]
MSFLSALFCCFDNQETERRETVVAYPKLSATQSNLQKALNNKPSNTQLSKKSMNAPTTERPKQPAAQNANAHDPNEHATLKQNAVTEITDLKDYTDSSKDDDTLNQIADSPDHQTQVLQKQAVPRSMDPLPTTNPSSDVSEASDLIEDEEEDAISNEEELDEDQLADLDLTRIQTDQVVAASGWLLDPPPSHLQGRKCLVLDLDETLVHSSFKYIRHSDFVIPVEIENQMHNVYVIKRPGVDEFLKRCGELYEVVVFTASVSRYGDPLLDILDVHKSVHHRLFRESCYNYQGNYIKNLSQMGRPLKDLIIIDNSPASYIFHPQHSIPISSWFSDTHDCELTDLLPFLEDLANKEVDDVSLVLDVNL